MPSDKTDAEGRQLWLRWGSWAGVAYLSYSIGAQLITGSVEVGKRGETMVYTRDHTPVAYWVTFAVFTAILIALVYFLFRNPTEDIDVDAMPPTQEVIVGDVAAVIARLKAAGNEKSSVDFTYWPPGEDDPDKAFLLSFALKGGRVGLHWIPDGPEKKRHRETFEQIVASAGHTILNRKLYGEKSLRVEETAGAASLPELFEKILREFCSASRESKLNLDIDGFTWP